MQHTQNATLAEVRDSIDALDREIVRLIAERQRWVVAAGKLKGDEQAVRAPDRVERVIRRVRGLAEDQHASPEVVEAAYRALIGAFIDLELTVHRDASAPVLRPTRGAEEYPALVEIWRSAVRATHDFLPASDFERIESNLAANYFPAVTLVVAEVDGQPVGFAGVADGGLEMLFVHDAARGRGVGSALLAETVAHLGVTRVDVNEQNPAAHSFYLGRGFREVGRSELDGDGRPFPLLHLELGDV